jgi:3-oxoacyl-[acyl-carrier-protein] synthase-1
VTVHVAGVGARAALGTTPLQIAMAARAQRLVPRTLPWLDRRGRRMGACTAVGIAPDVFGYDRLLALAAPAAWQASKSVDEPVPLMLALPEPGRADDDARFDGTVADLAAAGALLIDSARSRVFRAGHAGGAHAVAEAMAMLAAHGAPDAVLVGGVDSWIHPELLRELDGAFRLHALDVDDGFIPSEGAAFMLLRRGRVRGAAGVRSAATARENSGAEDRAAENSGAEDAPNVATAMTALVHACTDLAGPIGWVLSDVNGERHRISEWSRVAIRTLAGADDHVRIPDLLGDIGAATGTMAATLAVTQWRTGCAPAATALVALHADGVDRGVLLLEDN